MLKVITILVCLLASLPTSCQSFSPGNKEIKELFLQTLHSDELKDEFRICNGSCCTVDLFDYNNQLIDWNFNDTICDRKIAFYNSTSMDHPTPNSVVLYKVLSSSNRVVFSFYRPFSGAAITFSYNLGSDGEFKVADIEIGSF